MLRILRARTAATLRAATIIVVAAGNRSAAADQSPADTPSGVDSVEQVPTASPPSVAPPRATTASAASASPQESVAGSAERVTLEQAIQRALRRNPSAQIAALELDRADALVRQARAASLPVLNANATYTRLDDDRMFGTRLVAAKNQFNANLALSVPLVAPARWAQWSHSKNDAAVIRLQSGEVRRQLAISVGRTFLSVVSQRRVLEVNERALATAQAHEKYAAERLSGGVGRRIDAVRAAQQVAATTASVQRARIALKRSMEALGILVGEDRPVDVAIDPALDTLPTTAEASALAEHRRDVRVARARMAAARQRFRDRWLDFLPQVIGQFSPFYQTPATLTMPETGWQAMLLVTLPLYDGGARYGAHDERKVLRDQTEQQLRGLLRQARSEVRIAFDAQSAAEAALVAAREAANLAHQSEQMAVLAYEAGALTNLEVIDAERVARDADTEVAVAEDGVRQARLDLLIAAGRFPQKE